MHAYAHVARHGLAARLHDLCRNHLGSHCSPCSVSSSRFAADIRARFGVEVRSPVLTLPGWIGLRVLRAAGTCVVVGVRAAFSMAVDARKGLTIIRAVPTAEGLGMVAASWTSCCFVSSDTKDSLLGTDVAPAVRSLRRLVAWDSDTTADPSGSPRSVQASSSRSPFDCCRGDTRDDVAALHSVRILAWYLAGSTGGIFAATLGGNATSREPSAQSKVTT